jgi:hypothetical protein
VGWNRPCCPLAGVVRSSVACLSFMSACRYFVVEEMFSWPSHNAMMLMSWPAAQLVESNVPAALNT